VSRERVRQIEVRAFEKVQKAVKNRVAAMESPPTQPQLAVRQRVARAVARLDPGRERDMLRWIEAVSEFDAARGP